MTSEIIAIVARSFKEPLPSCFMKSGDGRVLAAPHRVGSFASWADLSIHCEAELKFQNNREPSCMKFFFIEECKV